MMEIKEAKAAINCIAYSNLSEKYCVIPFDDEMTMEKELLERVVSEYTSYDSFIEELRGEHPIIGTHLRMKNDKIPAFLKMIGYMLDINKSKSAFFCGREKELMKMKVVINKKIKNNILLVGQPGVGKTKLVEEFATRNQMHNVFVVECAKLIGSTEYRGAFEQRTVELVNYAKKSGLIIFFDEIHSLINLGKSTGGMSITDILKSYLLDEKLTFIGATTLKEAQFFLEDEAFKRRFSVIKVDEPSNEELLKIKQVFEENVLGRKLIRDEEVDIVIRKLREGLPEMFFPDKMVDFLDYMYSYKMVVKTEMTLEKLVSEFIDDQKIFTLP